MAGNENNVSVGLLKELANSNLNSDTQSAVIKKLINDGKKGDDDSVMDKIFGKRNPQIYVTMFVSIILLILLAIFTFSFKNNVEFVKEIWNIAIPAMTLLWGYAFGKSQSK